MTPEAQRIAIAEACGWQKMQRPLSDQDGEISGCFETVWFHPKIHSLVYPMYVLPKNPPNYPHDLNAMHEAEKVLTREMAADYLVELSMFDKPPTNRCALQPNPVHATAAQRAESFLRTIGKWEDDK